MVFALTRSYRPQSQPVTELKRSQISSIADANQGNNEKEIVGFIALYHDNYFGYSSGWRQTIGMINEYLQLAVLHLQLLSNRFDQAQDFAKHELRHQAVYIRNSLRKLKKQNEFIKSPTLANSTITTLRDFDAILTKAQKSSENYQQLQELITRVVRAARASQDTHNNLMTNTSLFDERINRLSKIEDLDYFDIGIAEAWAVVDLSTWIINFIKAYRATLMKNGVYIDVSGMGSFRVKTYSSLIHHIFTNILQNATLYCRANSTIDISSNSSYAAMKKLVTISNIGPYDSNISAEELLVYGRRGIYAKDYNRSGDGIGLWVVNRACDLAGIRLKYVITPINTNASTAQYPLAEHLISLDFTGIMT